MLARCHGDDVSDGRRSQTAHFPLLFEGGRQWGLSMGYVNRLVVAPVSGDMAEVSVPRWSFVFFHKRAPRDPEGAEFRQRCTAGLYAHAGNELRALGLGFSARNDTLPGTDGLYELTFDSRNPFGTHFTLRTVERTGATMFQPTSQTNKNP